MTKIDHLSRGVPGRDMPSIGLGFNSRENFVAAELQVSKDKIKAAMTKQKARKVKSSKSWRM